jgi:hypothetical protein
MLLLINQLEKRQLVNSLKLFYIGYVQFMTSQLYLENSDILDS